MADGIRAARPLAIPASVARRTELFVERPATVRAISAWLDDDAALPWFLVTGGPGSGKSALLAWLAGAGPVPADREMVGMRERIRSVVDSIHFCDADGGRAGQSLDPLQFANGTARQLSDRYPDYLPELSRQIRINLNVSMQAGSVGTMYGPTFRDINAGATATEFNLVVKALRGATTGTRLIAVDALDEAELWRDPTKIAELVRSAASGETDVGGAAVRFLLTSRPVASVLEAFPAACQWDLDVADDADVATYVVARLRALGAPERPLADTIARISTGNFLLAKLLVDFVEAHPAEAASLAADFEAPGGRQEVWKALDGVYTRFLQREFGVAADSADWTTGARPLLGTIAVAREKLGTPRLRRLLDAGSDPLAPGVVERSLPRCLQYLDGDLPDGPFGPYHYSFREFLFNPARSGKFGTDEWVWHRFVADRSRKEHEAAGAEKQDEYVLRHLLGHLADAARLAPAAERRDLVRTLVDQATSARFRRAHARDVDDPVALLADFEQVIGTVSRYTGPDAVALLVRSTLSLEAHRRDQLLPAHVFDLADRGDLPAAERRLGLFFVDDHWRQAALLVSAWLAAPNAPGAAGQLGDRLAPELVVPPLGTLLERVRAAADPDPPPVRDPLPAAPAGVAEFIVSTLTGVDPELDPSSMEFVDAFGLGQGEHVDAEQLARDDPGTGSGDQGAMLRAEREAPYLVAHARDHPAEGDRLLARYIDLHAANSYVLYRNRSLWAILESVARHPVQDWVRDRAQTIVEGALGAGPEFGAGLGLTVLGLRARAGDAQAMGTWDGLVAATLSEVDATADVRGSDVWAYLRRRLIALAEVEHHVFGRSTGLDMACRAIDLRAGFAGFHAPAGLTVAETLSVVGASGAEVAAALEHALRSAHNVQDPVFCARTTARVNAMRARWWGDALDPLAEAERLVRDPADARYGARHVVHDLYEFRERSKSMIELREEFCRADTLEALAYHVYQRPAVEFSRVNPDLPVSETIPSLTPIVVPDRPFSALVAARLAGELLARHDLDRDDRRRAAQSLVPVAAHHATALDTVLSRLLLIDPVASMESIDELSAAVPDDPPGAAAPLVDPLTLGPA